MKRIFKGYTMFHYDHKTDNKTTEVNLKFYPAWTIIVVIIVALIVLRVKGVI
ncbi:hypothetical protein HMPREF0556_10981 [Listeria grayi DSM 20601]|uniref:Uncharacterized protein n=1 Tax=Listeria grayi DSM 20601 TaxID=525367 RepID=D7UXM0_LISGR|nr:hypothetical protein HMPREF0556_10981 [Listeria grayi DSM 20601]